MIKVIKNQDEYLECNQCKNKAEYILITARNSYSVKSNRFCNRCFLELHRKIEQAIKKDIYNKGEN